MCCCTFKSFIFGKTISLFLWYLLKIIYIGIGALEFLKEVASVEMYKPLNTDTLIDCYSKRMTAISGSWSSSKIKEDALSSLKTITAENENSLWENIQFVASRRLNPTGMTKQPIFRQRSFFIYLFYRLLPS